MPDHQPDLSYCAALVRQHDRERFVTALFAPADRRDDLFALYALNVELARIREQVRDPLIGLIRLQWWRAALLGSANGEGSPVLGPARRALDRHHLDPGLIDRMLIARERDFDDDPPADPDTAEILAAEIPLCLGRLSLTILTGTSSNAADMVEAVDAVASAWGILGHLRATAYYARLGRVTLPASLLPAGGADAIRSGRFQLKDITAAVRTMAERADAHLARARAIPVPRATLVALLPAIQADRHAKALRCAGWNPFDVRVIRLHPRPLALAWTMWRGHL